MNDLEKGEIIPGIPRGYEDRVEDPTPRHSVEEMELFDGIDNSFDDLEGIEKRIYKSRDAFLSSGYDFTAKGIDTILQQLKIVRQSLVDINDVYQKEGELKKLLKTNE